MQQTNPKEFRIRMVHHLEEQDALCVIHKYRPQEWEKILLQLEQRGEPKEIPRIKNLIKQRLTRYEKVSPNAEEMPLVSVFEAIGNLHQGEATFVPSGYVLDEAGVRFQLDLEETTYAEILAKRICPVPLIITERSRHLSDEVEFLEISWYAEDAWHSTVIRRRDLDSNAWSKSLLDNGFPYAGVKSKEIVRYIGAFESANIDRLNQVELVSNLGWYRSGHYTGFFYGHEFLYSAWEGGLPVYQTTDGGTEQMARGFHCKGSLETWFSSLATTFLFFPSVRLGVYAGFCAPLLDILGCPSFIVDYGYRSSMGKSTTLKIIASIWGNPDESDPNSVIRTWNSTYAFIGRILGHLNSLPLILDETKLAKSAQDVADVIYLVANGRERGRATSSGVEHSGAWKTVLFSSGEKPIVSFTPDGGTRGRTLGIQEAPFGDKSVEAERLIPDIIEMIAENYGHAGRAFVLWLLENMDHQDEWIHLWETKRSFYSKDTKTVVSSRLAGYMAVIDVVAQLLPEAIGFPIPYNEGDMVNVWKRILESVEEEAEELRALRSLYEWAKEHRERFGNGASEKVDHCAGRWDEDGDFIAFMPTQFESILKTNEIDIGLTKRRFRELGWINTDQDEHFKRVRMNGQAQPSRAMVLKFDVILSELYKDNAEDLAPVVQTVEQK